MWSVIKKDKENWQKFSRTVNGNLEEVRAPIYIGDGRYHIKGILSNSGGFGVIYIAEDKRLLGREVLIKARKYGQSDKEKGLFSYEYCSNREEIIESVRGDVMFEYRTLTMFKKNKESRMPNVNDIVLGFSPELYGPHMSIDGEEFYYDNEEICNSEPYAVMQVIEGQNLADYASEQIDKFSTPEWEIKVLEIAKEITTILKEIHRRQKDDKGDLYYYIYRDLKPDNIMITGGRYLTLLDFGGISLVMQNADKEFISNIDGFGVKGLGTRGYRAPESITGSGMTDILDQRVDIYTLGATMMHLLVGGHINDLIDERTELLKLELLDGKCSDVTRELIEKCVAVNREDRYKDMSEVMNKIMKECFTKAKKYWNSKTEGAEA